MAEGSNKRNHVTCIFGSFGHRLGPLGKAIGLRHHRDPELEKEYLHGEQKYSDRALLPSTSGIGFYNSTVYC